MQNSNFYNNLKIYSKKYSHLLHKKLLHFHSVIFYIKIYTLKFNFTLVDVIFYIINKKIKKMFLNFENFDSRNLNLIKILLTIILWNHKITFSDFFVFIFYIYFKLF